MLRLDMLEIEEGAVIRLIVRCRGIRCERWQGGEVAVIQAGLAGQIAYSADLFVFRLMSSCLHVHGDYWDGLLLSCLAILL